VTDCNNARWKLEINIIPCISVFMFLKGNEKTENSVPNYRRYSLKKVLGHDVERK